MIKMSKTDANTGASLMHKEKKEVASPWLGPKGMIPVTRGQADDANLHNRAYLDSILVEMRIIGQSWPTWA